MPTTSDNHEAHDYAERIREWSLESLWQLQKLCQKTGLNDKLLKSSPARLSAESSIY